MCYKTNSLPIINSGLENIGILLSTIDMVTFFFGYIERSKID